jgi:hypothetical protein
LKYFIQYPLSINCDLKCSYCFHSEKWNATDEATKNKYVEKADFDFSTYQKFRDKHLSDGTEFLMELFGGEMSHRSNQKLVLEILEQADKEIFQLQTNGLGHKAFYESLIQYKDKIDRIGFTYHRKPINEMKSISAQCAAIELFKSNVLLLYNAGIKVIVKELLHKDSKLVILDNKRYWESRGIEFRIQDARSEGGFVPEPYTDEEMGLIHSEYLHGGENCSCRKGYKNVIFRGYDIFKNDVLCCWHDQARVGDIVEDWYNPDYTVGYNKYREIEVKTPGKEKLYHGGYYKDLWSPEIHKKHPHREKHYEEHHLKPKGVVKMVAVTQQLIQNLQASLQDIDSKLVEANKQVNELTIRKWKTEGAIEGLRISLQEMEKSEAAQNQEKPDEVTTEKGFGLDAIKDE